MVPMARLELAQDYSYTLLKRARLPIPPHRHGVKGLAYLQADVPEYSEQYELVSIGICFIMGRSMSQTPPYSDQQLLESARYSPELSSAARAQVRSIQEEVRRRIRKECGCKHEVYFQHHVGTIPMETLIRLSVCDEESRYDNPNCAHATVDFCPHPYDDQIRTLIELRILQRETWESWMRTMKQAIADKDLLSGQCVRAGLYSLPVLQREQAPNVYELLRVREILLMIMERVLRSIDAV